MKLLKGIDVSHWNSDEKITSAYEFVICKASEGSKYKDPTFNSKLDRCSRLGINLVGAYHYAKTIQLVKDNVDNFLNCIYSRKELFDNMILALDIEGEDIRRPNTWPWVLEWCELVYSATGIRPLVYTSSSYTIHMKELFEHNYGLWVAHWNVSKPKINHYPFWAFWQYAVSDRLDHNYFNGNEEQYLKYCRKEETT